MNVTVVMPAWNEEQGIEEFIDDLNVALSQWTPGFVVVDDCSTDSTAGRVEALAGPDVRILLHRNGVNVGHGPSTVTALRLGLESEADAVVAIDGDGQFLAEDVARVVRRLVQGDVDVIEGVRTNRADPLYRRVVSSGTRLLVWSRVHQWPADANTPLRAYRPDALERLLDAIPVQATTPNLLISVLCRRWPITVAEVPVASIPRRGESPGGSTWGGKSGLLPNKRFVAFCARAVREWWSTPIDVPVPTRTDV